jgi:hypothetical protein
MREAPWQWGGLVAQHLTSCQGAPTRGSGTLNGSGMNVFEYHNACRCNTPLPSCFHPTLLTVQQQVF